MRIAIVSDTHGQWQNVLHAIEPYDVDYLFFLGDHAADGRQLAETLQIPALIVKGNCDGMDPAPAEIRQQIGGVSFLLCHGDWYRVKDSLDALYYHGAENQAEVICFGHSHVPVYVPGDITMINPGSASRPRMFDELPSWGLLELEEEAMKKIKKYEKKSLPKF